MKKPSMAKKFMTGFLSGLVGVGLGIIIARSPGLVEEDVSLGTYLGRYCLLLALLGVAYYAQLILHEGGHLVFGLLTGYRFLSFRVGSLMLVRTEEGLRQRRLTLTGTGGQCLLEPPPYDGGQFPFKLYNLGGVLMNLITAALFFLVYLPLRRVPILGTFLLELAAMGVVTALLNGIPLRLSVPNDGRNTLSMAKNPEARRAFWAELKVNAEATRGVRLRDMPEDWFALPSDEALMDPLSVSLASLRESRLMDSRDFEGAAALIDKLFAGDYPLSDLHLALLASDRVFCSMVLEGEGADISMLDAPAVKPILRGMRSYPAVIRTQYAAARLKGDEKACQDLRQLFEKVALSHPVPADIASERELMALVK